MNSAAPHHNRDGRLTLTEQARAIIAAYDNGDGDAGGDPLPLHYAVALAGEIVALHRFDAAQAWLRRLGPTVERMRAFATLRAFLAARPAEPAPPPTHFIDNPGQDLQLSERPGSDRVLLVFCGVAHRFAVPLPLIHQWFGRLGTHVVYLRDYRRLFFLHGLSSTGGGYGETLVRLDTLVRSLGARRILTTGNSSGAFAALRYGLDLGAEATLSFAGPTHLLDCADAIAAEEQRLGLPDRADRARLDAAGAYAAALSPPRLWHFYAAGNENDRGFAEDLAKQPGAHRPGLILTPLAGLDEHDVLGPLMRDGRFASLLADFVAP